jgi:hypothetical protein
MTSPYSEQPRRGAALPERMGCWAQLTKRFDQPAVRLVDHRHGIPVPWRYQAQLECAPGSTESTAPGYSHRAVRPECSAVAGIPSCPAEGGGGAGSQFIHVPEDSGRSRDLFSERSAGGWDRVVGSDHIMGVDAGFDLS